MEHESGGMQQLPFKPTTLVSTGANRNSSNVAGALPFVEIEIEQAILSSGLGDGSQITQELPIEMRFNEGHLISIIAYSILMVFSSISNFTVLITILRLHHRGRESRISLFILHLTVADLLVTFLLMPLEIAWKWTVAWTAGDGLCRVMAFFRTFGLYLSGFLLVCISLDRYHAVMRPLDMYGADKRARRMLRLAWLGSAVCSVPQAVVFHVERHPTITWYEQCVTFNSFPTPQLELLYIVFGFIFLYGFPFVMIVSCYACILWKICTASEPSTAGRLRRTNAEVLGRAKIKTLKLTVTIVVTFSLCWTPYNVMTLWYMIDRQSAQRLDQRIQKGLFLFACTNSCVNPLVYGFFHFRKRREVTNSSNGNLLQPFRSLESNHGPKLLVRWKPHNEDFAIQNNAASRLARY